MSNDNLDNLLKEDNMQSDINNDDVLSFSLASLNSRAIAFLLDLVIVAIVSLFAFGAGVYFLEDTNLDPFGLRSVFMPIYLLLFFLGSSYFVVLNGYGGKTVGKMFMGIRVISDEGGSIGFWQSFVRWIGYYISGSFLFLGFVWSIFDRNSQSWHDKIAGTFVVKE